MNKDQYPSVTTILSPFIDFSKIPPDILEYAKQRGTAVHLFAENHSLGLWQPLPDDDSGPYCEKFKMWFDENVEQVILVEKRLYSAKFQYQGKPDIYCRIKNLGLTIVDYKNPVQVSKTWAAQVAAYFNLVAEYSQENTVPVPEYGGFLQLAGTKEAKFTRVDTAINFSPFLNALYAFKHFMI